MKYDLNTSHVTLQSKILLSHSNERGVALIVVLLFLILIMLAGVMAVRQSNTDLKTATADQINTILLQSSDSANEKMEAIVNGSPTSQEYQDVVLSKTGMFGRFMGENYINAAGDEYVYCFNPRTGHYQVNNATVFYKDGGTVTNQGICNYQDANDYTSERQTVMTQVSVTTTPAAANLENFGDTLLGTDSNKSGGKITRFDVRSTSSLPSYNTPTNETNNAVDNPKSCFGEPSTNLGTTTAADAVLHCLHTRNIPSKMLYSNVVVAPSTTRIECIRLGKVPIGYSLPPECR